MVRIKDSSFLAEFVPLSLSKFRTRVLIVFSRSFFYAVNKRYVFLDVLNGRIGVITKGKKKNARTSYRADAFRPLSPLPLNSFIATPWRLHES